MIIYRAMVLRRMQIKFEKKVTYSSFMMVSGLSYGIDVFLFFFPLGFEMMYHCGVSHALAYWF